MSKVSPLSNVTCALGSSLFPVVFFFGRVFLSSNASFTSFQTAHCLHAHLPTSPQPRVFFPIFSFICVYFQMFHLCPVVSTLLVYLGPCVPLCVCQTLCDPMVPLFLLFSEFLVSLYVCLLVFGTLDVFFFSLNVIALLNECLFWTDFPGLTCIQ